MDRRAKAFGLLRRHLGLLGVTVEQQASLWRLLAGLLHLCEAASAGADTGADGEGSEGWRRDALRTAAPYATEASNPGLVL